MTPEERKTSGPLEKVVDAVEEMQRLAQETAAAQDLSAEQARDEMADLREARGQPRTYVVQPGDYLEKIAKDIYGDWQRWKEIYEANKDQIEDPNLIHPGQELRIP